MFHQKNKTHLLKKKMKEKEKQSQKTKQNIYSKYSFLIGLSCFVPGNI